MMRSPRPVPRRWVTPSPRRVIASPAWVPGRDLELLGPVEGVELECGAQGGRRHRQLDGAVQVVTAALEGAVGPHVDLDVEVAGRSPTLAHLTLAAELDTGAGVDAGGDLDLERAAGPDPSVAGALEAGADEHLAVALAGHAGPGRHDLAEERPLHLLDLAATAADVTGAPRGAGLRAVTVTGGADHRRLDDELLLGAEDRVGEVDVEAHEGVLAAALARARATLGGPGSPAEEGVHDVAEREPLAEARCPGGIGVGAHVVGTALLGVAPARRRPGRPS